MSVEAVTADPTSAETVFAKRLASNDKKTRDKAVKSLRKYLTHRADIPAVELLKLWKGIFYCMWMSDKPLVQQQLCDDLAGLVDSLSAERVCTWLGAFWATMCREWPGIDKHRVDKFYLLMRRYVAAAFKSMVRFGWDANLVSEYASMLVNGPLSPYDSSVPNSVRLHIIDIYLNELEKLVDAEAMAEIPTGTLLMPFCLLMAHTQYPGVSERLRDNVFNKVIEHTTRGMYVEEKDDTGAEDEAEPAMPYDLVGLSESLFEIGADADVSASGRKRVYRLSEQLKMTANTVGSTVLAVDEDDQSSESEESAEERESQDDKQNNVDDQQPSEDEQDEQDEQDDEDLEDDDSQEQEDEDASVEQDDDSEMEDEENEDEDEEDEDEKKEIEDTKRRTRSSAKQTQGKRVKWNLKASTVKSFRKQVPLAVMPSPIKPTMPGKSVLKRRPNDVTASSQESRADGKRKRATAATTPNGSANTGATRPSKKNRKKRGSA